MEGTAVRADTVGEQHFRVRRQRSWSQVDGEEVKIINETLHASAQEWISIWVMIENGLSASNPI